MIEPLTVSVEQAKHILNMGHTSIYRLLAEGKLKAVKVYGKTLIPYSALKQLIAEAETWEDSKDSHHKSKAARNPLRSAK